GDLASIESMLAEDATYYGDGGGHAHASPRPILGVRKIANLLSVVFRKRQRTCVLTTNTVNGQPGIVFSQEGTVIQVLTFASEGGRVRSLYSVLNPEKLYLWAPSPSDGS
ncbi:RNA polymerase subunit sigma-24, partial [Singulisphaera rosea]